MKLLCVCINHNIPMETTLEEYQRMRCDKCYQFLCSEECKEEHICGFSVKEWKRIKEYYKE